MKKIQIEKKYQSLMELWIEDLEANGALQGEGYLYNEGKFCCLGRLCIMNNLSLDNIEDECYIYDYFDPNNTIEIPNILMKDTELSYFLSKINDGVTSEYFDKDVLKRDFKKQFDFDLEFDKQYTFAEIANFLKQRLEYV